ncbi:hypothetical protein JCM8547_007112 [Rhodosporidiobolus lusitaniae]
MRVRCATFNAHLAKGKDLASLPDDLRAWLGPSADEGDEEGELPEFVAVGFQELIPLHLALLGFTSPRLSRHIPLILPTLEPPSSSNSSSARPSYVPIAQRAIGGIALVVFARRDVSSRVERVETATVGCGAAGLMGNKGAVGVRVTLLPFSGSGEKGGEGEGGNGVLTFVTAHLQAHQSEKHLRWRNRDWRSIVEGLVFIDERDGRERGVYETGQLFVFGDLNYRTSLHTPNSLPLSTLTSHISTLTTSSPSSSSFTSSHRSLLSNDQLTHERLAGRTLHHLSEAPISFAPTYKFKLGTDEYTLPKRIPSWTDRVLFASAVGEENVKAEEYRSVMSVVRSDHKPVTALFSLPSSSLSSSRLPFSSPFPINPSWRLKQILGFVLDRLVGSVWCFAMLAGFNRSLRVGIVNILLAALTVYYHRSYL